MGSKIDRTGEKNINNFGSEMIIVDYRKWDDVDVYFPEYNWIIRNKTYGNFKKGEIKCPYEPSVCGVGYVGEGKYKASENGKATRVYNTWHNMLKRCYSEKYHKRHPTYINCSASEEFHNFQNFGEWDEDNYYEIEGEKMCLDKDILVKHNKIYSPETCIYVPNNINMLFVKKQNDRGKSVIGTYPFRGKYQVKCHILNLETGKSKNKFLGYYDTQEKAFDIYKQFKEDYIKQVANYYKGKIPTELYDALYRYEVEIND